MSSSLLSAILLVALTSTVRMKEILNPSRKDTFDQSLAQSAPNPTQLTLAMSFAPSSFVVRDRPEIFAADRLLTGATNP